MESERGGGEEEEEGLEGGGGVNFAREHIIHKCVWQQQLSYYKYIRLFSVDSNFASIGFQRDWNH